MSMGLGIIVAGLAVFAFLGIATAGAAGAAGGAATSTGGASTSTGTTTGGTGQLPRNAAKLNANQRAFASRLQADTGLNPSVIAGWLLSEEPASASQAPNGANNWLNIGAFDAGGWAGGGANVWASPTSGADATASFLTGHPVNGISSPLHASSGIRGIVSTAGQSVAAQIRAIQTSGWATSGYPDLPGLVREFL